MILNLIDAGFETNFTSLYWTYASGFPKAADVSKLVDKRYGRTQSNIEGMKNRLTELRIGEAGYKEKWDITKPATPQAKKLEGAYAGFQPKPAVEVILTVMKPLSEKTFVDQALSNGKGVTWLDDCRIPYQSEQDVGDKTRFVGTQKFDGTKYATDNYTLNMRGLEITNDDKGRFPANLLVEDDVLNDGSVHKSGKFENHHIIDTPTSQNCYGEYTRIQADRQTSYGDSGSFSRYFSLDSWTEKTLPFLITPKPSKAEKGVNNSHPTVKSRKLMSYLITMGSREGDIVLDPFCGSGTVLIAARQLARDFIGCEINEEYIKMAMERLKPYLLQTRLQ